MEKKKCAVCGGSGTIPSGAWSSIYDDKDCRHCAGTGIEPKAEVTPTRSSPFEEDGFCVKEGDVP